MRWSYKTVHYELKKEGLLGSAFLDESEVELSLNEFGRAGWELVSMLETMDGLIAIFKQPLFGDSSSLFQIRAEAAGQKEIFEEKEERPREVAAEVKVERPGEDPSNCGESEVVEDDTEEDSRKEQSTKPEVDVGEIRIE